jgi:hypothetical protein
VHTLAGLLFASNTVPQTLEQMDEFAAGVIKAEGHHG